MSLADLSRVNRTPQEWSIWSFSNQAQHIIAARAIFTQKGISVPQFPLDPIPPEPDARAGAPGLEWLFNHQQSHNAINAAAGTEGVDLTAVDFSRQDQAETWAWLHLSEHLRWAIKLGLT